MNQYILSVDIGTTAIKGAVIGEDGVIRGSKTSEYELITLPTGEVEQSMAVYERAFREAVAGAMAGAGVDKSEVACLGFSATGETVVCMDGEGRALRNVMAWMDTRSIREAEDLTGLFPREELLRRTGAPSIRPSFLASKILWVKRHEPEIFARTRTFAFIKDYFIQKLFGTCVSEDSLMCDAGCWDIPSRRYWAGMLEAIGIEESRLPEVVEPGTELGVITAAAAAEYGLDPRTRINVGGMDQACGAVGAGNLRPGVVSESTGSALVAVFLSDSFRYDPSGAIPMFCAGLPGQYMFQPFSTGAIIMKWYRDQFCGEERAAAAAAGLSAYDLMDRAAEKVPAGSEGLILLPYFQGSGSPDVNKKAKGVYYGLTGAHTRAHLARAAMEGLAMALRRMVEATEPLCARTAEIRSLGGGAKSGLWCQIKADVLNIPVKAVKNSESAACMGAAILAGVAAGIWPSAEDAAGRFVEISAIYLPQPRQAEIYRRSYEKYVEISRALDGTFT